MDIKPRKGRRNYAKGGEVEEQYVRNSEQQAKSDATDPAWLAQPDNPAFAKLDEGTRYMAEQHEPSENVDDRRNQPPYEPTIINRVIQAGKNIYENLGDKLHDMRGK